MMEAYVEGLPIPFFSSSLTSAASENLAGGLVYFWSKFNCSRFKISPSANGGKIASSGSLDAVPDILVYPSKTISLPLAEKTYLSRLIFTDVERYSASGICEAINCCHISS